MMIGAAVRVSRPSSAAASARRPCIAVARSSPGVTTLSASRPRASSGTVAGVQDAEGAPVLPCCRATGPGTTGSGTVLGRAGRPGRQAGVCGAAERFHDGVLERVQIDTGSPVRGEVHDGIIGGAGENHADRARPVITRVGSVERVWHVRQVLGPCLVAHSFAPVEGLVGKTPDANNSVAACGPVSQNS